MNRELRIFEPEEMEEIVKYAYERCGRKTRPQEVDGNALRTPEVTPEPEIRVAEGTEKKPMRKLGRLASDVAVVCGASAVGATMITGATIASGLIGADIGESLGVGTSAGLIAGASLAFGVSYKAITKLVSSCLDQRFDDREI